MGLTRAQKQERAEAKAKSEARRQEAIRIVTAGKCPQCGRGFRRNLAMAGWYQCVQFGAEGFRAEPDKPSCSFQTFTE